MNAWSEHKKGSWAITIVVEFDDEQVKEALKEHNEGLDREDRVTLTTVKQRLEDNDQLGSIVENLGLTDEYFLLGVLEGVD